MNLAGLDSGLDVGLNAGQDIELLENFATEIGREGSVTVRGGGTQWEVGGLPKADAREVKAPTGVWSFAPADMVVRCGAGTTVAELNEKVGRAGQMLPFDPPSPAEATVGGLLAVGQNSYRRLRYGPLRDLLLQIRFVNSLGQLIRSGGPTVKNVSGFDLCKLMVGSLGTLGFIAEVILQCQPVPEASRWFSGGAMTIPNRLLAELWQPSSILWNGEQVWVLLEGHRRDIEAASQSAGLAECEPPVTTELTSFGKDSRRISLPPATLKQLPKYFPPGSFIAEIGVGIAHLLADQEVPADMLPQPDQRSVALQREIKARFDPSGRMNPGRSVWRAAVFGETVVFRETSPPDCR